MRGKWLLLSGIILVFALLIFVQSKTGQREQKSITRAYNAMRAAVASGDTNTMLSLISPLHRKLPVRERFAVLFNFLNPLDNKSKIKVSKNSALVFPRHERIYLVIPAGVSIEMEKLDGAWLFTGKVDVD